jgi:hypothetical protein
MIETTLRATSEKLNPGRVQHFRRAPQLVGAEDREESFDHGAACRRAQVAARDLTALHLAGERVAWVVEARAQLC